MKTSQLATRWGRLGLALTGLVLLAACAADGYNDDERFASGVKNTQLLSPESGDIVITASADGRTQTISWPVVHGAGGYLVSLYNTEDRDNPLVKDSLVDGCSLSVSRAEDTNYELTLQTLGNDQNGNKTALEATVKQFNTFAIALATIPAGNLSEYFRQNPIPDSTDAIYYNLEAGATYTLPDTLELAGHHVILRCTDKTDRATIVYGEAGRISTSAPLTLQNLVVDCSGVADDLRNPAAIALSTTPDETIKGKTGDGNYYNIMTYPIYIVNCDFEGVKGMFFYDNNLLYCVETMLIENCKIHFNVAKQTANLAYIYTPGGFIKDLTIKNTTMWNTGEGNLQYFVRYNNAGRLDRAGYDRGANSQSVSLVSCTFYNLAYGWWANYNGFAGQVYTHFDIEKNIFVNCAAGGSGIARRLLGGRAASSYGECIFGYNTYWQGDSPEAEGAPGQEEPTYDLSGTALQTDPALVNPAGGNLTPTGAEQLQHQTGDPRWLN